MPRIGHVRSLTAAALVAAVVTSSLGVVASGSSADRSLDGAGNNVAEPSWGAAPGLYTRLDYGPSNPSGNAYDDHVGDPARPSGTNPREISNALSVSPTKMTEPMGFNDLLAWWMFHVHVDLAAGIQVTEAEGFEGLFDIEVPVDDVVFEPGETIRFRRSLSTQELAPPFPAPTREIYNIPTAFLDADPIYQRSAVDGAAVRTGSGGLLHLQESDSGEGVIPTIAHVQAMSSGSFPQFPPPLSGALPTSLGPFPGGVAISTMLVREHNRVATALDGLAKGQKKKLGIPTDATVDPAGHDEAIFQLARKIVEAEAQAITYHEVLPAMGVELPEYTGYDDSAFPAVFLEFASGPLRLHTMLNKDAARLGPDGTAIASPVDSTAVFSPGGTYGEFLEAGMDPIIRGMLVTPAQRHDLLLDEGLRSVDPEASLGFAGDLNDLMATHINRGRDRGLPAYPEVRRALGLAPVTDFGDITTDVQLQLDLSSVYASVADVDPIVGMLAEDRVAGSVFGETAKALYELQFTVTRDADRFWYQTTLTDDIPLRKAMWRIGFDLDDSTGQWILDRTLADLIADTTSIGGPGDKVHVDAGTDALMVQTLS